MSEDNRTPLENEQEKKKKFSIRNIFYHNTFVLLFSFLVAVVSWFAMAMADTNSNVIVRDVPIEPKLSASAEEDGLRIFNMSYNTADLEISGSNLITNKLTPGDFQVTVTLNPTSTKLTGNTLQKMTLPVRAAKLSSISDYVIESISPEEINVEYDRYKEASFPIENEVKYSADSGFTVGSVSLSEDVVVVSGPESSVNKISRAVIAYDAGNPLREDISFTSPIRLYDQNNQEIKDMGALYLETSVDTVEGGISVIPMKTVPLKVITLNQPKSFPESRIKVEPAEIDIAGPAELLDGIKEITLDMPVNFMDLDLSQKNVFTQEVSLPSGVRDLSVSGENAATQATVSINLNGYRVVSVVVPEANIQINNLPVGKTPRMSTRLLEVKLVGPEAQVSKLTGESLSVQVDLTSFSDREGIFSAPASVIITGSGGDACWVLGQYTLSMSLILETAVEGSRSANAPALGTADGDVTAAVNAVPQE